MSGIRNATFYNSSIEAVKDIEDDATIMFGGDSYRVFYAVAVCSGWMDCDDL